MATSDLNYVISVQLKQLGELQKLHDTIAGIQALSSKGAEFNVRVNSQSLDSLTKDISDSVSKGFSNAGGKVGGGLKASVDTAKLEASIAKLSEVVSSMGRVRDVPAPTAAAPNLSDRLDARIREVERAIKAVDYVFDTTIAKRTEQLEKAMEVIRRGSGKAAVDTTAGDAALRESLVERRARLESARSRVASYDAQRTPGLSIDSSILNKAFETGSRQLSDALRKGIADATAALSKSITDAVVRGMGAGQGGHGYRPISEQEAEHVMATFGPHMRAVDRQNLQDTIQGDPGGRTAGAARRGAQYLAGAATRDASMTLQAAAGGVMAFPPEYKELLTRRVSNYGEAKRLEEQIQKLRVERGQAEDQMKSAINPADRTKAEQGRARIQGEIEKLELQKSGAITAQINKQIESAALQYQASLKMQADRGELTPEQYTTKTRALEYSLTRLKTLKEQPENVNLEREMLLLPDALAQYVRQTLQKYVQQLERLKATNQPIDDALFQEIESNNFMSNLVGGRPTTDKQVGGALYGTKNFLKRFGAAKTAYEFLKSRAVVGLPTFNPNLDVDTAPFMDEGRDVGPKEWRKQYLESFLTRGGAFAPQTEERRLYAERIYKQLAEQDAAGKLNESGKRRLLEYQREMEFGGRYYYPNSAMATRGHIEGGALLSPGYRAEVGGPYVMESELARVRAGGARSAVLGNPLGQFEQTLSADAKAARDLYQAMGYVEGALGRLNKTLADLSNVSFDPVIKEFQRLGEALKPYAESLAKVKTTLSGTNNIQNSAGRIAVAEARQKAVEDQKTAGVIERATVLHERGLGPGLRDYTLPQLAGMQSLPETALPFSNDPARLRKAVQRTFGQIGTSQFRMFDQNALIEAQIGAGVVPDSAVRAQGRNAAQFDALMATYATNVSELTKRDPRFFGRNASAVSSAAQGVIDASNSRRELGDNLRAIQEAVVKIKEIDIELAKLNNVDTPSGTKRRDKLQNMKGNLEEFTNQRLRSLQDKGLINDGPAKNWLSVAPVTIDVVAAKYGQVNAQLAKMYDNLLGVTKASVDAANAGGGFAERVISKLQNLAAYVTAGGIVYTLASQLRTAASEAVGLEADLARIQGVLASRSQGQAANIGAGVVQGAMDYGTSLRQSVQAGKLFAQTGANPQQTVDLTRASLAGQVGAGLEAQQATELLIAVENITNRQVQAFDILDRISRVESQYAVTAQDLSTAIQRAGSLATQLQPQALGAVSALDLIIGSATTIIERTRVSGDQAATSLRFIISRLAAPEVARALQDRFGIKLAGDTPNTLRPLQDILQDIATKYNDLRKNGQTVQAQQLLSTFAGARQANTAAALLGGFDDALKVASQSAYAFGDTQERVRIQLDTIQARFAQFNTAFSVFAASLLNDTGLAGLLKYGLRAATSVLETGSTGMGAFGVGAGAYVLSLGAGKLASRLLPAAAAAGAEGAEEVAQVGSGAALGGKIAGRAASILGPLGIGLAVTGVVEMLARVIKDYLDRREAVTFERFSDREFRSTPFFQAYSSRAEQYGMGPEQLRSSASVIAENVNKQVEQELSSGQLKLNQRYSRTNELLVSGFEKALPGFATLGDQATKTAEALAILRDTAKFDLAPAQTYFNEFMTDLSNVFADIDKQTTNLGAALRSERARANESLGAQGAGMGAYTPANIISVLDKAFNYRGARMINSSSLSIRGQSLAQLGASGSSDQLGNLDLYARNNLLLGENARSQLDAAESALRSKKQVITEESRYQEALRALSDKSLEARTALQESNRRYQNQTELASQIVTQLKSNLSTSGRLRALEGDRGNVGLEPGEALAASLRQTINLALRKLEAEVRAGTVDSATASASRRLLDGIRGRETRIARDAALTDQTRSVRDRLFEPIVTYASRMADVRSQSDMSRQFGTSFDMLQAKADAAQELMRSVNQVPIQLLSDRIRIQARLLGGTGAVQDRGVSLAEDGGSQATAAIIAQTAEGLMGTTEQKRNALAQITTLKNQYESAMTTGLGGFIQAGLSSPNENVRLQAEGLQSALHELGRLGTDGTQESIDRIIRAIGGVGELIRTIKNTLGSDVDALVARQRDLSQLTRTGDLERLNVQLTYAGRQSRLQNLLGYQQTNPRMSEEALATQREILLVQQQSRIAAAQQVLDSGMAKANRRYAGTPFDSAYIEEVLNLRNSFESERRAAMAERGNADAGAVSQLNTQLGRRQREESLQLVQDLTNPLKSFLMSSKNFSREGYQQLFGGIGQAAQQRLVDIFMRQMFSETGMVGDKIANAFSTGALSTETAIERGFRLGVAELNRTLTQGFGGSGGMADGSSLLSNTWTGNVGGVQVTNGKVDLGNGRTMSLQDLANANVSGTSSSFNWKGALNSAAPVAGSLIGSQLGNPAKSYSGEGAAVGAMLGNMLLPGLGGFLGGLAGGALGGLFGKNSPEPERQISSLEKIEANTRQQIQAIENQTKMLTLDSRFMNVPTGFTVPGFRPFGVGGGGSAVVNINMTVNASPGQDERVIADHVAVALQRQLRSAGTSFDVRN